MSPGFDVAALTPLHATSSPPGEAASDIGARPPEVGPRRVAVEAGVGALAVAAAAAVLFATALYAYLYIPFSDAHDWAAAVFRAERSGDWLGYIWAPHNSQRMLWVRIVEALDIEWTRGRAPVFLWAGGLAWLLGAVAVAAAIARAPMALRTRVWLGVGAGLLLADVMLAEDLSEPIDSLYLFCVGPVLAAAVALASARGAGLRSPALWAAVALAVVASGGGFAALVVWPAMAVGLWLDGRIDARLGVVGLVGAVLVAVLEAGLGAPSASLGAGGGGLGHLVKTMVYFLAFCGLPWSRLGRLWVGDLLGVVVLAGAGLALRRAWRDRGEPGHAVERAGAVLVVFGLLAALLAAVGRVDELPAPIVPERYTPFAAALQLGVGLGLARALDARLRRRADAATAAALAAIAAALVIDLQGAGRLRLAADRIRAASVAFDRGATTTGDIVIHPRPAVARAVRAQLRARGLPS